MVQREKPAYQGEHNTEGTGQICPQFLFGAHRKVHKDGGWSPADNDVLWCVLDVDRWSREEIEGLRTICEQHENWNLAISNPCFEVWLLYHNATTLADENESCARLKQKLHEQLSPGGYNVDVVAPLVQTAAANAKNVDNNPQAHFPDRMKTKIYLLAEQMVAMLGSNWQLKNKS